MYILYSRATLWLWEGTKLVSVLLLLKQFGCIIEAVTMGHCGYVAMQSVHALMHEVILTKVRQEGGGNVWYEAITLPLGKDFKIINVYIGDLTGNRLVEVEQLARELEFAIYI